MSHVTGRDLIRIRIVSSEPNHLIRLLGLLWRRLGSAQIYAVVILSLVLLLAGVGVWHLIAPGKQIDPPVADHPTAKSTSPMATTTPATVAAARISPAVAAASSPPAPSTPAPASSALERQIAITDLTEEERPGPRGEDLVIGTIGLTSRTDVEKNHVEIAVFFFDLTPNNEMRPTKAQITYRWLTPIRDWSDPEPKYLAATYVKPPSRPLSRRSAFAKADPRRMPDDLRYGGFIVRVYSEGKLQDERSQPENLIANLPRNVATATPPAPSSRSSQPPTLNSQPSDSPSAPSSRSSQPPTLNTQPSEAPLPNGIPIPGKPGFVSSPYDPKFIIDVRGFPPGTLVNDPNTNKPFRVP